MGGCIELAESVGDFGPFPKFELVEEVLNGFGIKVHPAHEAVQERERGLGGQLCIAHVIEAGAAEGGFGQNQFASA